MKDRKWFAAVQLKGEGEPNLVIPIAELPDYLASTDIEDVKRVSVRRFTEKQIENMEEYDG